MKGHPINNIFMHYMLCRWVCCSLCSIYISLCSKKSFSMWHQYIKPLIDRGVPDKLLDFIDFHAYNNDISPEVSVIVHTKTNCR